MSTIKSFDDALDFYPTASGRPLLSRIGQTLRIYATALSDGMAAARAYNELAGQAFARLAQGPLGKVLLHVADEPRSGDGL